MYADLLSQQLPYDQALVVLQDTVKHPSLRWAIGEILQDLRKGKRAKEAFGRHVRLLGQFTTGMLILGFSSGNMAVVCASLARFLERDMEIRRLLRRLVIRPMVAVLILWVVTRFMGSLSALSLTSAGALIRPLLSQLLSVLPLVAIVVFVLRYKRTRVLLDRCVTRLSLSSSIHKMSIERFARAFHALYTDSSDNIRALRMAASVCGNRYMEQRIREVTIPMLKRGKGLMESLEASRAFTGAALVMLRSGHASGSLRRAALRLADHCASTISYQTKMLTTGIDVLLALALSASVIPLVCTVGGRIP